MHYLSYITGHIITDIFQVRATKTLKINAAPVLLRILVAKELVVFPKLFFHNT